MLTLLPILLAAQQGEEEGEGTSVDELRRHLDDAAQALGQAIEALGQATDLLDQLKAEQQP
jgi:hypothetical protein